MQQELTLKGQTVHNQVRTIGINPNHWYAVTWSNQLKPGQVMSVAIWQQAIALYRNTDGQVHAVEDACPHKGVELHRGEVKGDRLVCPYHGWEFGLDGELLHIPYLPPAQTLPCASVRTYPVQERYGLVWIFPGDPSLADSRSLPEIPEFSDPTCLLVPVRVHFNAHFSLCNENGMDVFHGFLHRNLQSWFNPVLIQLQETETSVCADYRVSFRGWLTKLLGLGGQNTGVTTRIASINYRYPHYCNTMEGVSSLYLIRLPIDPDQTDSFALLFLKQIPIPRWLLRSIEPLLVICIRRFLFMPLAKQDIDMMENEWHSYQMKPDRRLVEINPAVVALQRVMRRQYEQSTSSLNTKEPGSVFLEKSNY